jgi:iron complex outermembrane receptor protein
MKKQMTILLCLGFVLSHNIGQQIQAAEMGRGTELSIFEEIPVITIASKRKQLITEAPSTVSVITAEDIKNSGAADLEELFRLVPGIDVMAMSVSDYDICARGMNVPGVDKMLVLLDKRCVYLDFYGIVVWSMIPVALEDIKRIEIIKGPGSAMYGANAYSGVINIMTKSVEESEGTLVKAAAGEGNTLNGSLIHAGTQNDFGYKLSLNWKKADEWSGDETGLESFDGSILTNYAVSDTSRLSISAGRCDSPTGKTMTKIGLFERDGTIDYVKLNYDTSALNIQCFRNKLDVDTVYMGADYPISTDTYDMDIQRSLPFGRRHMLTCGGSYRHNKIESTLVDKTHTQDIWAVFLDSEIRPAEKLILNLGTRYDRHSLIGEEISPRASLIYTPAKRHIFRIAYGTAFKNPHFVQSYLHIPAAFAHGNEELDPEELTAYEFGYQTFIGEKVKGTLNLFLNEYKDFILFANYSTTQIPYYTYRNIGKAESVGGEIGLNFLFTDGMSGILNYSYQELTNKDTDERIESAPEHKLTAGLRAKMGNGYSASLTAHYVDETYWENLGGDADSYTLVNARIAREFLDEKMEIALNAYNLLNDKHREHPWGEEIGERIFVTVRYRF